MRANQWIRRLCVSPNSKEDAFKVRYFIRSSSYKMSSQLLAVIARNVRLHTFRASERARWKEKGRYSRYIELHQHLKISQTKLIRMDQMLNSSSCAFVSFTSLFVRTPFFLCICARLIEKTYTHTHRFPILNSIIHYQCWPFNLSFERFNSKSKSMNYKQANKFKHTTQSVRAWAQLKNIDWIFGYSGTCMCDEDGYNDDTKIRNVDFFLSLSLVLRFFFKIKSNEPVKSDTQRVKRDYKWNELTDQWSAQMYE